MTNHELSEKVRKFIFQHIDSVELLDVLLYLRSFAQDWQTPAHITRELRSNESSILSRLEFLQSIGLAEKSESDPKLQYRYLAANKESDEVVALLAEDYKAKRHQVLALIFSPSRQAKQFADAFIINRKTEKKKGDANDR